MEARAVTKFARVSPRKMRLVVDQVRGRSVEDALTVLKFVPKGCAGIVAKTLRSAVANASDTQNVNVDLLYVKQAEVGQAGSSSRSTSTLPVRAAVISTVSPSGRVVSGSAPAARSASTIGALPRPAARTRGVTP